MPLGRRPVPGSGDTGRSDSAGDDGEGDGEGDSGVGVDDKKGELAGTKPPVVWVAALVVPTGLLAAAPTLAVPRARRCRHTTIWLIVSSRRAMQAPLAAKWRIISCNKARSSGNGKASSDCGPGPRQVAIDISPFLLTAIEPYGSKYTSLICTTHVAYHTSLPYSTV